MRGAEEEEEAEEAVEEGTGAEEGGGNDAWEGKEFAGEEEEAEGENEKEAEEAGAEVLGVKGYADCEEPARWGSSMDYGGQYSKEEWKYSLRNKGKDEKEEN